MVKITGFGKARVEDLRAFEEHNHISLPDDYRRFLLEHNGGLVESGSCHIGRLGQDVLVQSLLGLEQVRDFDLQGWLTEYQNEMPRGSLIVAVGATGLFILVTGPSRAGVYFWDHEHAFDASSEATGNTYEVGGTFAQFIDGLHPVVG